MESKETIIDALKAGHYSISIEGPNNVEEKHHPDGSVYYVLYNLDSPKYGTDGGSCQVFVCGETFSCDLNNGDWYCNGKYFTDREIIDALEAAEGVLSGEMLEPDQQIEVYERANNCVCKEYYWYEDDDCPMDPDDIAPLEDFDLELVSFEGADYYLTDEEASDEDEEGTWYYAIPADATPEYDGSYCCVLLLMDEDSNPIALDEDCEACFTQDGCVE